MIKLLKQLAELIADEADQNPSFAGKLNAILDPLPKKPAGKGKVKDTAVPDVFTEYQAKGADEFSFWLRTLDLVTLKAVVRISAFDPTKKPLGGRTPINSSRLSLSKFRRI